MDKPHEYEIINRQLDEAEELLEEIASQLRGVNDDASALHLEILIDRHYEENGYDGL